MIEFTNIKKAFDGKVVLDDVGHVMQTGKCNLIIGTSGSGKTVLQKCLVGLMEPDDGQILYDGKSFTSMDVAERVFANFMDRSIMKEFRESVSSFNSLNSS